MEYSKSQKGNRVLLYRGYEYLHDRSQNGVTFWRCRYYRSLKCRSSLRNENDIIIQEPIYHSHDSCPQKASAKLLQEQMKDKMTALSATNRNVIGEALTDVSSDVLYLTYQKRQIYLLDGLHCICFYFDLLLHCNQSINSLVYCL